MDFQGFIGYTNAVPSYIEMLISMHCIYTDTWCMQILVRKHHIRGTQLLLYIGRIQLLTHF